jgi:hypothetical protein
MRSRPTSPLFLAAFLALATAEGFARADCRDPPPVVPAPDPTQAERLFVEAKELLKDGRTAEACAGLAQSQALDPAGGTLLELAYCLELQGKLATSYARYEEALALAQRDQNDRRAELAHEHLTALAPRLVKIEIRVSAGARAQKDLEIRRDGACVDPTSWDKAVAVDPGKHVITAVAPGTIPWEAGIELTQEGSATPVEVPPLQMPATFLPVWAPPPPPRLLPLPAASAPGSLIPGIVVLGVGVVGLGVSAGLGQTALTMGSEVLHTCRHGLCPPSQQAKGDQANVLATASTVGFIAGAVIATAGVVFLVVKPFGGGKAPLGLKAGPGSLSLVGTF